ncbi:MAG: BREX system Lon protease-like protein BrxL [Clostridia bacterium]|nr:BREX system Lon protease-like protein BrxL [Clostridia bacterium]
METKLKEFFGDMLVYKSSDNGKFFSALSLPSFMRDWLVMRFSDSNGQIDKDEVSAYVKRTIPQKEQWKHMQFEMIRNCQPIRFLAKIKIDFDTNTRTAFFSLPDFGVPKKKGEAIADWDIVEQNKNYLLAPNEVWGIVEIMISENYCDVDGKKGNVIKLVGFKPFCPYNIDLDYYCEARKKFSTEEWIDVLLSSIDYNPTGYHGVSQKMTMISRLLPFVEKRINLIELAPKGTGKSYLFSQISKYGWLVSGGSISRAKMFYDMGKRNPGLAAHYDYVAFDEVQSITFPDKNEMQGALKGYLESGEFRIGDYKGVGDSGLVLLGNIDSNRMNVNTNMFINLPDIFHESALIDRFHGFIKGWEIPRMKENLKVNGWALNVEYFSEIMHMLRGELIYRAIIDEILVLPKNADTRDTEAIKRICTAFMKLIFPNIRKKEEINLTEFENYCLEPAREMRRVIKTQLGIIDNEFFGKDIPDIGIVEIKNEEN